MEKLKIAILFGGRSEEHDVSIKSAVEIARYINTEKYEPIYIYITKEGAWKLYETPGADLEKIAAATVLLSPDKKMRGLIIMEGGKCQIIPIDVVFPILHGKMGEDGSIQGLLELSGIPYVGCGVTASAVCMDKSLTYLIVRAAGFATPKFRVLQTGNRNPEDTCFVEKDILPKTATLPGGDMLEMGEGCDLHYPVFMKPARSGSSFGVTKVYNMEELCTAIQKARRYDNKILLEETIVGVEVGCAVLGNEGNLLVGEVDQITLSHGIFRIHQETAPEKGSENAVFSVPAKISMEKRMEIQAVAKEIYQVLGCTGLARVDFFLQENGRIVLNEVNTMPGFTAYSRYPRMMAAAGIAPGEVIDRCIDLALRIKGAGF